MKKGSTLIELILVVAILTILGAINLPLVSRMMYRNKATVAVEQIVAFARKAQTYASGRKNNDIWGICIVSNKLRLYQNSCSSPVVKDDYDFGAEVTASDMNLVFDFKGQTTTNSIVVHSQTEDITVNISDIGVVNVQK